MHPSESYKKPVGRPATGRTKKVVTLNFSYETESMLSEYCIENNRSKSEVVDTAIKSYLNQENKNI